MTSPVAEALNGILRAVRQPTAAKMATGLADSRETSIGQESCLPSQMPVEERGDLSQSVSPLRCTRCREIIRVGHAFVNVQFRRDTSGSQFPMRAASGA